MTRVIRFWGGVCRKVRNWVSQYFHERPIKKPKTEIRSTSLFFAASAASAWGYSVLCWNSNWRKFVKFAQTRVPV